MITIGKYKEAIGYIIDYDNQTWGIYPIIEYDVDGLKYRYYSKISKNRRSFRPQIGKEIIIKYNPKNPRECYEKFHVDRNGSKIEIFLIISSVLMGIAKILEILLTYNGKK